MSDGVVTTKAPPIPVYLIAVERAVCAGCGHRRVDHGDRAVRICSYTPTAFLDPPCFCAGWTDAL